MSDSWVKQLNTQLRESCSLLCVCVCVGMCKCHRVVFSAGRSRLKCTEVAWQNAKQNKQAIKVPATGAHCGRDRWMDGWKEKAASMLKVMTEQGKQTNWLTEWLAGWIDESVKGVKGVKKKTLSLAFLSLPLQLDLAHLTSPHLRLSFVVVDSVVNSKSQWWHRKAK